MPTLTKNHPFRWSSFWSWRLCKQAKLSHLGHRKPARIHRKANAPKTSHCGFWTRGIIGSFFFGNEQGKAVTVNGDRYRAMLNEFLFTKIEEVTFGFNRTALRAIQPKLHSMFCVLFMKIALSAAEPMSFGHLRTAMWQRWTIICGVSSKISVMPTSQRQLTL